MTVGKSLEGPGAQGQSSPPLAASLLKLCKRFPWVALRSLHLPGMVPPPDSRSHSPPVSTAFLSQSAGLPLQETVSDTDQEVLVPSSDF